MPKRRPAAACRPSGRLNLSHAHHRGWRPGDRPCSATQERLCTHRESQARHGSAGWTGCATSRSVCGQGGARLARAGAPRMQGMRSEAQGPWVRRACTPAAAGGGTGGAGSERRHRVSFEVAESLDLKSKRSKVERQQWRIPQPSTNKRQRRPNLI